MEPITILLGAGALVASGVAVRSATRARQARLEVQSQAALTQELADRLRALDAAKLEARAHADEAAAQAAETARAQLDAARRDGEQRLAEAKSAVIERSQEEERRSQEKLAAARAQLEQEQQRLRERRAELDRHASREEARAEDLRRREQRLSEQEEEVESRRESVTRLEGEAQEALERVAEMTRDEAREQVIQGIEEQARKAAARRIRAIEDATKEQAEQSAKNILSMAIQRYAGEYTCERTVSVVNLPSEEMKGRIIGREGRNIRSLEAATGVDFIIDDTPECIVISAFNPIRREVARRSLEILLEDGRIHPSRVEGVVRKTEAEFHKVIRAAGEEAADEAGISGIHPEILKLLGALKYRTSYGQNQWQHAIEVAFLCGMMASELGLDVKRAKRAGLLHDIGKVMDQTAEGSHALIGAEFARTHGEHRVIVNAIASHHEEVPQETVYACLAQAADAISGARPGARRQMMQSYNQRLSDLERISNSFPGVERSYAVQAGRELRVLVENGRVTDEEAVLLSHEIAHKIESEMAYPGQIKVTVIRETRVVNYAR